MKWKAAHAKYYEEQRAEIEGEGPYEEDEQEQDQLAQSKKGWSYGQGRRQEQRGQRDRATLSLEHDRMRAENEQPAGWIRSSLISSHPERMSNLQLPPWPTSFIQPNDLANLKQSHVITLIQPVLT